MNPNSSPATSSPITPSVALAPYGYAFFVQESPSSPKEEWPRNGMIFATETEAKQYGCDLLSRWFGICGGEVRPVDLQPTYKWVDGRAERLLLPIEQPEGPEGTAVGQDAVGPCRGGCGGGDV